MIDNKDTSRGNEVIADIETKMMVVRPDDGGASGLHGKEEMSFLNLQLILAQRGEPIENANNYKLEMNFKNRAQKLGRIEKAEAEGAIVFDGFDWGHVDGPYQQNSKLVDIWWRK